MIVKITLTILLSNHDNIHMYFISNLLYEESIKDMIGDKERGVPGIKKSYLFLFLKLFFFLDKS